MANKTLNPSTASATDWPLKRLKSLYLIGSLRNDKEVTAFAIKLQEALGIEVYASWASCGPNADDHWKTYELARGSDYAAALDGWSARNVFAHDKYHLDRTSGAVMLLPCGKSCHLELGYTIGMGKPGWIMIDDPDRWDVMYRFATDRVQSFEALVGSIRAWDAGAMTPAQGSGVPDLHSA